MIMLLNNIMTPFFMFTKKIFLLYGDGGHGLIFWSSTFGVVVLIGPPKLVALRKRMRPHNCKLR
jgi:hypothetical protein